MMSNGKVTVKLTKCRGEALCGRIVALKEPVYKDGTKKIDKYNPDKSLSQRPLIGLSLLQGMEPDGPDKWSGAIYNPDDGRTYSATMALQGSTMRVKGCVLGILCKNNDFRRVN
jgi:uncharacterized protein (DUF2147 family)